jgi:hypothetical protein
MAHEIARFVRENAPAFFVRGRVVKTSGQPIPCAIVKAVDVDLRSNSSWAQPPPVIQTDNTASDTPSNSKTAKEALPI